MSRGRRTGWQAVAAVVLVAIVVAATACGVQPDEAPRRLAVDEVPYGLLDEGPPIPAPTTTTPSIDRVNVAIYYVRGERLQPTARAVRTPATASRVVDALLEGPTDEEAVDGLRTAINPSTTATVTRPAPDVVAVDLTPDFAAVPTSEQRLALGQIVFTATGLHDVQRVRFTIAGAPVAVPLPDGTVTSEPVSRDAFPNIAPQAGPAPA